MKKSKKALAMLFACLPGAGHMYMGLQKQGLEFMSIFFFTIFFGSWLNLNLFMFVIPIIWFYNFFDVLKKVSMEGPIEDDDIIFVSWIDNKNNWLKNKNKVLGYACIIIGAILIADKIILPRMSWEMRSYIETSIVALLFILGGVKLLMGNKVQEKVKEEEENI